ncbi:MULTISPECIES: CDP-diacylglycerol--serine O-phosphatidyltransferase [Marinimicrobium]|jgi:CDP-diacylglycerol--serine O-phosphatidyltransferase|uniref:CDP-diacylglycerol--serine O-phosphatidyltransferase n=1 Tax=Marinimicrobium koreense TaxID=306545 RepID=A0A3N1NNK8_9GAMM|nr:MULTISPECIES: CDP-diacylglycerol--serine O-phosphatidyltransferase [Marinimicrobium]MAN51886.1 CDP-diacylglycerol--serine O-phosphatidyltransferase [Marinimicrobium sp.]ROQ17031.1 CDP-diacylglycerol--serine O-phosphatidyltransferase [Marinimicrobium koreense]|tara:strand:- start:52 stop:954 length:903 start_codon:yes stop_codon:yes gene_type:complete
MTNNDQDSRLQEGDEGFLPFDEHVEEVSENGKKVRHRGVYFLPNLFTTGALFAGFYAIISAMHGNFDSAAIAIFVAMALDGLDGRVARLTNTSSAFGEQYDSLSDMVSFGLAPSLVMFSWALSDLGKLGWAAAFVFAVCAALRLARFNTQIGVVDKKYFVGLASPPSAAILASIVWTGHSGDVSVSVAVASALITTIAGLLMVSNVRYYSFKDIDFRGRVPFVVMLMVVGVFVVVSINPPVVLLCMSVTYGLSGPAIWLWRRRASLVGWVNSSKEGDDSSAQGSAESGEEDAPEEVRKEP